MKTLLLLLSFALLAESPQKLFGAQTGTVNSELSNKNANERTKCIYKYISELSSKTDHKIISGQMTNAFLLPIDGYRAMVEKLHSQTGKWVGIIGTDYQRSWPQKITQTKEANQVVIDYAKQGGLVHVMWSASNPWTGGTQNDTRNNKQIADLVKAGTAVNLTFNRMLDSIAMGLSSLQDSGVTILWRPFHEMNGSWFWWGSGSESTSGAEDYKNLWKYIYNYFTIGKSLNNLIWVFSTAAKGTGVSNPSFKDEMYFYPGDEYVDIIGVDVYNDTLDIPNYSNIKAQNKPIALSEFGPSKAKALNGAKTFDFTKLLNQIKTKYPDFVYWMSWNDFSTGTGGKDTVYYGMPNQLKISELLNDSYVVTRDDFDWDNNCMQSIDTITSLSNKNASEQTQCVYKYLAELSKKPDHKIISGQMINMGIDYEAAYQNDVVGLYNKTNKWVGLIGSNYQRSPKGYAQNTHATNKRIIEYFKAGGLVTMFCSFSNPWTNNGFNDTTGRYRIMDLIDSTKPVYKEWLKRLDSVAVGIKELQDSGVVVLYRFFPENNGNWFWWGVQTPTTPTQADWKKLWIFAHNYFSNIKKLNNILWVFAPSAKESNNKNPNFKPDMYYYPGNEYVDIVGTAVYNDTLDIPYYDELKKTGRPIALTEFGPGMTSRAGTNYDYTKLIKEVKKKYPDFVYWLAWNDFSSNGGKDTVFYSPLHQQNGKALLEDNWVVNRDEVDWRTGCETPNSIDTLPINELGTGLWKNYQGGFYPEGKNERPTVHNQAGIDFANSIKPLDTLGLENESIGKIVLLSIGMSNTTQEYSAFKSIADTFKLKNPKLTIIDGAQGGQTAAIIKDPKASFWTVIIQRLSQQRCSANQVQAVWLKEANAGPTAAFPKHAQDLKNDLKAVVRLLKVNYPNLKLVYLSSRTYGGYANSTLNPEPYAYESGFAVKWLIDEQINGDTALVYSGAKANSPWLSWGPYLWGQGVNPRQDGLVWLRDDFVADGTHPSTSGRLKVANMLLDFFSNDTTAKTWFLKSYGTDVEDIVEEKDFSIFPNPTSDYIKINNFKNLHTLDIRIYNVLGECVKVVNQGAEGRIDLSDLPAGLYYIKVGEKTKIFIKI